MNNYLFDYLKEGSFAPFCLIFMNIPFFLFTILILLITPSSYATPMEADPEVSYLLKAPVIVIGKVKSFSNLKKEFLSTQTQIKVEKYDASIRILQIIKGKMPDRENILIKSLIKPVNPVTYLGRQSLEIDKVYVFFLGMNIDGKLIGINAVEFAIGVENLPKNEALPLDEKLRKTARLNIENVKENIALKWLRVLDELYDPAKDDEFLKKIATSTIMPVRGTAVAILCEHDSANDSSIYSMAMKFIKDSAGNNNLSQYRRKISKNLEKSFADHLSAKQLKNWLQGSARELNESALHIIKKSKNTAYADDIMKLMVKSKNRNIQYQSLCTISALFSKPGPGYKDFMKKPSKYVRKCQRWWFKEKINWRKKQLKKRGGKRKNILVPS